MRGWTSGGGTCESGRSSTEKAKHDAEAKKPKADIIAVESLKNDTMMLQPNRPEIVASLRHVF
jgi:hypothetical protein